MADDRTVPPGQWPGDEDDRMVTLPASALGVLMSVVDGTITATVAHCGEDGYPVSSYIAEAWDALRAAEAAILGAK